MTLRLPRYCSSSTATTSSLAAKKLSWAALKRAHSLSSSDAAGPAGAAPLVHEPLERARGGGPVGARRERLGLGDELLLGALRVGVLRVETGEVAATGLVEAVAGGAEPLPQVRLRLAVETRGRALVGLPLVEQLAHPGAARLPLDAVLRLTGDRLGLGHDLLALGRGRDAGLGPVLLLDVALGGHAGLDLVELGGEGVEVADDGRVLDLRGKGLESFGDVLGRHLGLREALLEEHGRGEQPSYLRAK